MCFPEPQKSRPTPEQPRMGTHAELMVSSVMKGLKGHYYSKSGRSLRHNEAILVFHVSQISNENEVMFEMEDEISLIHFIN